MNPGVPAAEGAAVAGSLLAVDLGRTGCRAALWLGGAVEPVASASGQGTLGLTGADGVASAARAILAVAAPLLARYRLDHADRVGIGAPGALVAPAATRELAGNLVRSLPARAVAISSDALTSHAGALAGEPGVVLAAGTGAVAIAIGRHGRFQRVDGWGPWLGDEGSGAWLGLAGLRAAARAQDGRGPETALRDAAWREFEGPAPLALKLAVDDNPARTVAAFAPVVARLAEQGDAVARGLVDAAAAALARAVIAGATAIAEAEPVPVALLGGLTRLGAILMDPFRAALEQAQPGLVLRAAAGTSLDGARRLATRPGGLHEPWTTRAGVASSSSAAISLRDTPP